MGHDLAMHLASNFFYLAMGVMTAGLAFRAVVAALLTD